MVQVASRRAKEGNATTSGNQRRRRIGGRKDYEQRKVQGRNKYLVR